MDNQEVVNVTGEEISAPEVILQKQIDELASQLKQVLSENASLRVQITYKEIELTNLKAIIDSQTTAQKQEEELQELIDENDISEVLMSGNY